MKSNKIIIALSLAIGIGHVYADAPLYLSKITNQTNDTLFKVWVADERYEILIFPNTSAELGQWFNFQVQKSLIIAPQKGNGSLPIFVEYGPEPSAKCPEGALPHSLIFWYGSQSTPNDNKAYQAYCQEGKNPSVELIIRPDLTVEIAPLNNIKKIAEF